MSWLIFGCTIPSLIVCWAAAFAVRRWGPGWGLVDRPGARKIHAQPMPTAGGLAIWLGVVLPLAIGQILLWGAAGGGAGRLGSPATIIAWPDFIAPHLPGLLHQSGKLWLLLGGGTVLMLLGLADDRCGLDWRLRLGVQTLVAVALVCLGWRLSLFLDMPWLTGTLTVIWIVGLVNSFNMLDNMDGLSAGVAAIAAAIFAAVMLLTPRPDNQQPQLFVAAFLLVILGSLLGFLWHNRPPARLFMGDAGSYLVGYLLATATLTGTFAGGSLPKHAILAPLCVLAVPLYDTASVVLIRLRRPQPDGGRQEPLLPPIGRAGSEQDPGRVDDLPGHGDLRTGRIVVAPTRRGRRRHRAADSGLHVVAGCHSGKRRPR